MTEGNTFGFEMRRFVFYRRGDLGSVHFNSSSIHKNVKIKKSSLQLISAMCDHSHIRQSILVVWHVSF